MSKERARNRAAREQVAAEQAATRAAVAAKRRPEGRAPAQPRPKQASNRKQPVYRQRRFPPLPWRLKLALGLGWLAVVLLGAYLAPTWLGRLGIAVLATFCLPLIVVIVRDPTRRTPR